MTREEAIQVCNDVRSLYWSLSDTIRDAMGMAIEALAKIEAIQEVVDMPALWEPDDRRRYAKIVDIVKKEADEECFELDAAQFEYRENARLNAECEPKEVGQ